MTDRNAVLALDVGGTTMKAAVVHPDGSAKLARTRRTPATPRAALGAAIGLLRELQDDARQYGIDPAAAGVVAPGVVDEGSGVIRYAANLGWRSVPLRELAERDLRLPVAVGHDVRAAAVAESRLGVAHGVTDFALISLGTGIGAALASDGRSITGAGNAAGELGHISIRADGPLCTCGRRGCLETYASGAAIARRYTEAGGTAGLTAREICAVRRRDPVAAEVWQQAVDALALGLANAINLLNPELVVIGGGVSAAGEALLEPLREALSRWLSWWTTPDVVLSTLGTMGGRTGAALLAMDAAEIPRSGVDRTWVNQRSIDR